MITGKFSMASVGKVRKKLWTRWPIDCGVLNGYHNLITNSDQFDTSSYRLLIAQLKRSKGEITALRTLDIYQVSKQGLFWGRS